MATITGTDFDDPLLLGTPFDDSIFGLLGDDGLYGDAGNDTLDGGLGIDTLVGGTGNDTYSIDSLSDVVTENVGEGSDTIISSVDTTIAWLPANVENLTLTGTAIFGDGNGLSNIITGNSSNNRLYGYGGNDTLYGEDGSDQLDGGSGADAMYGGTGNDIYYVDSMSDQVIEIAGAGIETVYSSVSTTTKWLPANVENLILTGTAFFGDGNDLNNVILGNNFNNSLWGYGGDDVLLGLDGDDYLNGSLGNDVLDGGTGVDTTAGGPGDDIYFVDSIADVVIENAGAGTDIIVSSVSISTLSNNRLVANVENLLLTGTATRGEGNDLDNTIFGNDANNILVGNAGNDLLYGGIGNDSLSGGANDDTLIGSIGNDTVTGGTGADLFVFTALAEGIDTITDFTQLDGDKIVIISASFGANSLEQFSYNSTTGALFFEGNQFATLASLPVGFDVNQSVILA